MILRLINKIKIREIIINIKIYLIKEEEYIINQVLVIRELFRIYSKIRKEIDFKIKYYKYNKVLIKIYTNYCI